MKTIIIKSNDAVDYTLFDLFSFNVPASGTVTLSEYFNHYELSKSSSLIHKIAVSDFIVNDGVTDLDSTTGIKYVLGDTTDVHITDEFRDRSGKLRVHQTSRKLGTMIMWTGEGDNVSDPASVGGGENLSFFHNVGDVEPLTKYIDFNIVENETWLHEGYVTWEDAKLDTLDLQLVPRVTSTVTSSGTSYNIYNNYLIVPAYPGTGTVVINSDITKHDGGLVYMPLNDLGIRSPSFWNAEWDVATQRYVNITAAPNGDGEYNLFSQEVVLAQFVRKMNLIANGFIALNSSDTDQLGHGMRLRMVADVNTEAFGDHSWRVACVLCLHREKSVSGIRI